MTITTTVALATYMHSQLRATATVLGWSAPTTDAGVYAVPVEETLLAYGVGTIALATDQQRLRLIAQREVWRAVLQETTGDTDYQEGDSTDKRTQIHSQAREMYNLAVTALSTYTTAQTSNATVPHGSTTIRIRSAW